MCENKKCNCTDKCTCGCQDGKECTCNETCTCGCQNNLHKRWVSTRHFFFTTKKDKISLKKMSEVQKCAHLPIDFYRLL